MIEAPRVKICKKFRVPLLYKYYEYSNLIFLSQEKNKNEYEIGELK